jgi:FlaA1/EpsC-like NDP-sugar epimerase
MTRRLATSRMHAAFTRFASRRYGFVLRRALPAVADAIAWPLALTFTALVRHDFSVPTSTWEGLAVVIPAAIALQLLIGLTLSLYLGRARLGSFDEVATLVEVVGLVTLILFVFNWFVFDRFVPASVPLAAGLGALTLTCGVRYVVRLIRESRQRPDDARRLLVFGGGEGGAQVTTAMLRDPKSRYIPVALLDDDRAKRRLRIMGIPVVGTRDDLTGTAARYSADAVLIAIPSADAELIRDVSGRAANAGLEVRVLPPVSQLLDGRIGVGDIQPLSEIDLLGRHRIETDVDSIAGYLTGRRVLVTGAGGSIGSELCRQIWRFGPTTLVMVDRDESALHGVQLAIMGQALLDSPELVIADLRERDRVFEVFERHRPDVTFHAAALKHVPLLEMHPREALKTNVFGTRHVLDAAASAGVERFVTISTDKAADPANMLGLTKRLAERLTASAADTTGKPYLSVRFGNVLGSRGSVLDTFRAQIDAGGPVTVTHPDVTRFFMTVEEAVELTIQAGAIGNGREVLVLDMGEPVRIAELAQRLVDNAERRIPIVYTGLRPGEKLHEVRLSAGEIDMRPGHPLISQVGVPSLSPGAITALANKMEEEELRSYLVELCDSQVPTELDQRSAALGDRS